MLAPAATVTVALALAVACNIVLVNVELNNLEVEVAAVLVTVTSVVAATPPNAPTAADAVVVTVAAMLVDTATPTLVERTCVEERSCVEDSNCVEETICVEDMNGDTVMELILIGRDVLALTTAEGTAVLATVIVVT